ncbi:hypothetical protein Zm00014a_007594 [Zea mays]|uniref:Uncharacterized protein n=1 Tax=Zea mays TaxID=4577 RepID=A0A317Y5R6_MAIZE|nr:hypothetical protein Zm00014a_007594 [Zea mays]
MVANPALCRLEAAGEISSPRAKTTL